MYHDEKVTKAFSHVNVLHQSLIFPKTMTDSHPETKQRIVIIKCPIHSQPPHGTRVKVDSGLSYDQLWGHRGVRVASVEQLDDPQQPAGLVRPVQEAVDQEDHRQCRACLLSHDGSL